MSEQLAPGAMRDLIPICRILTSTTAFRETFVADDDLKGSADQIGIVEFDAGSFVPIIPQYFDPCRLAIRYRAARRPGQSVLIG